MMLASVSWPPSNLHMEIKDVTQCDGSRLALLFELPEQVVSNCFSFIVLHEQLTDLVMFAFALVLPGLVVGRQGQELSEPQEAMLGRA